MRNPCGGMKTQTLKGKIISLRFNKYGYLRIGIRIDRAKTKYFLVNRLVAEAFLPNTDGLPIVHHKNGIRNDNRVGNLEWVSNSKNTQDGYDRGYVSKVRGENNALTKLTEQKVRDIRNQFENGISKNKLAKLYNVSNMLIAGIINRKYWHHVTDEANAEPVVAALSN